VKPETLQKLADSLVASIKLHVIEKTAHLASADRVAELEARIAELEAEL